MYGSDQWVSDDAKRCLCHRIGNVCALAQSGTPTNVDAYQKGVQYLLRTQKEDGSWHVKTRVIPFQKLFDSEFPHGDDQWISGSATGWAARAIIESIPTTVSKK